MKFVAYFVTGLIGAVVIMIALTSGVNYNEYESNRRIAAQVTYCQDVMNGTPAILNDGGASHGGMHCIDSGEGHVHLHNATPFLPIADGRNVRKNWLKYYNSSDVQPRTMGCYDLAMAGNWCGHNATYYPTQNGEST